VIKTRTLVLLALAVVTTGLAIVGARDEDPICMQTRMIEARDAPRLVRVQNDEHPEDADKPPIDTHPCPLSGLGVTAKASRVLAFPLWVGGILSLLSDLNLLGGRRKKKKRRHRSSSSHRHDGLPRL
jgi:hypothetical protein